jgi:hypothetical protein
VNSYRWIRLDCASRLYSTQWIFRKHFLFGFSKKPLDMRCECVQWERMTGERSGDATGRLAAAIATATRGSEPPPRDEPMPRGAARAGH